MEQDVSVKFQVKMGVLEHVKDNECCSKKRVEEQNGCLGPLTGGPQCRMSILRNGNVACLCRLFMAMSHVEFKK